MGQCGLLNKNPGVAVRTICLSPKLIELCVLPWKRRGENMLFPTNRNKGNCTVRSALSLLLVELQTLSLCCGSWAVLGTGAQNIAEARRADSLLRAAVPLQPSAEGCWSEMSLCLLFQRSSLAWSQLHSHRSQPKVGEVTFTVDSQSP